MEINKKDYFFRVYEVVRRIPKGRVSTYGAIAKYLGGSPRVVGYAMNASHKVEPKVPAHRVVNRYGMLTGKYHFPTPTAMQELLEAEGVKVLNDRVAEFDRLFWDPKDEGLE